MRQALFRALLLTAVLVIAASCTKRGDEGEQAQTGPAESTPATASPVSTPQPATPTSWTGDAINFSFTMADGATRTADSYAGKPLVLNFWAAW